MDLHLIVDDLQPRIHRHAHPSHTPLGLPGGIAQAPQFISSQQLPFHPVLPSYPFPGGPHKQYSFACPVGPIPQLSTQERRGILTGNMSSTRVFNGTTSTIGPAMEYPKRQSEPEKIPVLSFTEFRKVPVNPQGDKYGCERCNRRFTRKSDLMRHVRIHLGIRPNVCSVCSKPFVQRSALTVHMRVHTGEKPYSCQVCSRAFSDSSSLARHKRIHARKVSQNAQSSIGPAGEGKSNNDNDSTGPNNKLT